MDLAVGPVEAAHPDLRVAGLLAARDGRQTRWTAFLGRLKRYHAGLVVVNNCYFRGPVVRIFQVDELRLFDVITRRAFEADEVDVEDLRDAVDAVRTSPSFLETSHVRTRRSRLVDLGLDVVVDRHGDGLEIFPVRKN